MGPKRINKATLNQRSTIHPTKLLFHASDEDTHTQHPSSRTWCLGSVDFLGLNRMVVSYALPSAANICLPVQEKCCIDFSGGAWLASGIISHSIIWNLALYRSPPKAIVCYPPLLDKNVCHSHLVRISACNFHLSRKAAKMRIHLGWLVIGRFTPLIVLSLGAHIAN